ncbi:hypothetical protein ACOMHN_062616 [Nucella lapillus]
MGSMYMGHALLAEEGRQLLTINLMKYWSLPEEHSHLTKHRVELPFRPYRNSHDTAPNNNSNNKDDGDDDEKDDRSPQSAAENSNTRKGCERKGRVASSLDNSFAKIDKATLSRLEWICAPVTSQLQDGAGRGQRSRSAPPLNAASVVLRPQSLEDGNANKNNHKLTKTEYRRLTNQVRDVEIIIRNKFRPFTPRVTTAVAPVSPTSPPLPNRMMPSIPHAPSNPNNAGCYRTSPFPALWLEKGGEGGEIDLWGEGVCLSVSVPPATAACGSTPHANTMTTSRTWRVPSAPGNKKRGQRQAQTASADRSSSLYPQGPARLDSGSLEEGNFSMLTPKLISQLLQEASCQPLSAPYGDSPVKVAAERTLERKMMKKISKVISFTDDLSTTTFSSVDSDVDDDNVSEEEDNDAGDDDSSDAENGVLEPSLDDIRRQLSKARILFPLRPEQLEVESCAVDRRSSTQFDFDASRIDLRIYEFQNPLPDCLSRIDLRRCARDKIGWRHMTNSRNILDTTVEGLTDRLVALEKLQMKTEDWEIRKLQGRLRRQDVGPSSSGSRSANGRHRDRRNQCQLCLQNSCSGDCGLGPSQDKATSSSLKEWRRFLNGHDHQDFGENPSQSSLLKAYTTYVRRPKSKPTLPRPKSSVLARGKTSHPHVRPASATAKVRCLLVKDLEGLGLEDPPQNKTRSHQGSVTDKTAGKANSKNCASEVTGKKKKTKTSATLKVSQGSS